MLNGCIAALDDWLYQIKHMLIGCIAALDGWLYQIKLPSMLDTMSRGSFFSGHYQCHGLNVQAACDAKCHFIFLPIRCPGGTGDSEAFYGTWLDAFLKSTQLGFYAAIILNVSSIG
jgi:DDE superfamily endonuclease